MTDHPDYVTPEQAESKVCYTSISMDKAEFCYGSNCMAWRWKMEKSVYDDEAGWFVDHFSKTHGYCGRIKR